jgi:serine/threonine protein kinase
MRMSDRALPLFQGDTLRGGRYLVEQSLSKRTDAGDAVYRAVTAIGTHWERRVAIKVFFPPSGDLLASDYAYLRACHEGEMIAFGAARHSAIPALHDLFEEGGRTHVVYEFKAGPTLQDLFAPDQAWAPPWPQERLLVLADQLAHLLCALHAGSPYLLARDLKPGNLILERRTNRLAFVDLGSACKLRDGEHVPGWLRGRYSRFYAPLEQQTAEGDEDRRTDLYAMGAILRSAAMTWTPRPGASLMPSPKAEELRALGFSSEVAALIINLLQLHPDRRPASAEEVADTVARLLDEERRRPSA